MGKTVSFLRKEEWEIFENKTERMSVNKEVKIVGVGKLLCHMWAV
jgi:hypothetical protein